MFIHVKDLKRNQIVMVNGWNGKTTLNPTGHAVLDIKTVMNENKTIITLNDWDGIFEIETKINDYIEVEK